jgi:hypothetical protein
MKFSVPALFSLDLHPHVTKHHRTGPPARPNMPEQRSPDDDDSDVHEPTSPDTVIPPLETTTPLYDNESVTGSISTKERKRPAEQAVQHGIDMIKIWLDVEDAKHSVAAPPAQAPDSPLVDDDIDDLSIEDISVECMENKMDELDHAEIIQIDLDMETISRHIGTLQRPESTAHP